jgi:hypothetical protein
MSDIFISYKRENKDAVQPIVLGLRAAGFSVWWDQDIAPEAPWEATIERELGAAKVVIVAWSQAAVASENVRAEARRARNQGKLIQIFVETCEPPLFFGERQGVDLSAWGGATDDHRFQALVGAARAILEGRRPPSGVGYAPRKRRPLLAIGAAAAVGAALLSFIADIGGARDAICSIGALRKACLDAKLVSEAPDAAAIAADARARLLSSVAGVWGRQDRNCSETVAYSLVREEDGVDRIVGRAPNFESLMQVIAAENGVVVARSTTPTTSGSREQWEFRPDGDRLVIYDKDGAATTLVRCSA